MKNTIPNLNGKLFRVAEDQPNFVPVSTVRGIDSMYDVPENTNFNTVVMAFAPTPDELRRLNTGEEIYISLLTFGMSQQGIRVLVGPDAVRSTLAQILE